MKLSPVLLTSLLVGARAMAANIQHPKVRRDTTDTCAYFDSSENGNIAFSESPGGVDYSVNLLDLNGCYCLSTTSATIMNNGFEAVSYDSSGNLVPPSTPLAIGLTIDAITDAIIGNIEGDTEVCLYPDNSIPACTQSNVCGFTCETGFTLSDGDCICMSPRVLLDGACAPPGGSVDTCAYFDPSKDGDIAFAESQGGLAYFVNLVDLNGCYCLSTVGATIMNSGFEALIYDSSGNVVPPSTLLAYELTIDGITDAINGNIEGDTEVCTYPHNSVPACTQSNVCGFTCTNHFTLSGGDCVCASPRVLSDGACVIPGSPGLRRRDMFRDNSGCGSYEDACGVPGEPSSWECLDTRSALDSCGGCVYPPPSGLVADLAGARQGKDCTEIPHAMEIACRASKCVIDRCEEPYVVSPERSSCILSGNATSGHGILLHQAL